MCLCLGALTDTQADTAVTGVELLRGGRQRQVTVPAFQTFQCKRNLDLFFRKKRTFHIDGLVKQTQIKIRISNLVFNVFPPKNNTLSNVIFLAWEQF